MRSNVSDLQDHHPFHYISLADGIDHFQTFVDFTKHGMLAVKVCSVIAAMTYEELRSASIPPRMGHGKHTPVVILVIAI